MSVFTNPAKGKRKKTLAQKIAEMSEKAKAKKAREPQPYRGAEVDYGDSSYMQPAAPQIGREIPTVGGITARGIAAPPPGTTYNPGQMTTGKTDSGGGGGGGGGDGGLWGGIRKAGGFVKDLFSAEGVDLGTVSSSDYSPPKTTTPATPTAFQPSDAAGSSYAIWDPGGYKKKPAGPVGIKPTGVLTTPETEAIRFQAEKKAEEDAIIEARKGIHVAGTGDLLRQRRGDVDYPMTPEEEFYARQAAGLPEPLGVVRPTQEAIEARYTPEAVGMREIAPPAISRMGLGDIGAPDMSGLRGAETLAALSPEDASAYAAQQQALMQSLAEQATGTGGPTAAHLQYQQAAEEAIAAQRSAAASMTGTPQALAQRIAAQNIAGITQRQARESAILRAQEQQQAQQLLGQVTTAGRQADLQRQTARAQLEADLAKTAAGIGMQRYGLEYGTEAGLAQRETELAAAAEEATAQRQFAAKQQAAQEAAAFELSRMDSITRQRIASLDAQSQIYALMMQAEMRGDENNRRLLGSLLGAAGTIAGAYLGGPGGAVAGGAVGSSVGETFEM